MVPGALNAGSVGDVGANGLPFFSPVLDIGADLLGGTTAVGVGVDGGEADLWCIHDWVARRAIDAAWWLGNTNGDLVDPVGPIAAHGSVEEEARVAVGLSYFCVSLLGVNLTLFLLVVIWVGASLDSDFGTALPGVHLVVPAIVVKLDRPEQGVHATGVCGMDRAVVVKVLLDAEVAESALVERVLVDSAALVGGSLVVNLVLEASNGTERSALTVASRLLSAIFAPNLFVEGLII